MPRRFCQTSVRRNARPRQTADPQIHFTSTRIRKMTPPLIPNCVPHTTGREIEYVTEALRRNELAAGEFIKRFEAAICEFTGARHAVALSSGTAAVHLALLAAGVRPDDLVLTAAMTFAATANAVRYCGADPVFFDSEPETWGLSLGQVAAFLETCQRTPAGLVEPSTGRRVSAILPVHLYGHPVDLDQFYDLAAQFGVALVEDAAEALGAMYKGRPIGSQSRYCALSFNGNKIITGGAGGMFLTDDPAAARLVRHLANQAKAGDLQFEHDTVGFNYRMPNINAAVLCAQAEMLGEFVKRKREIVATYCELLADLAEVWMFTEASWASSSYWMAVVSLTRDSSEGAHALLRALAARNVQARPVWMPLSRQKAYAGALEAATPLADRLYQSSLCLPCSVGISDGELMHVAAVIRSFVRG